MASRLQRRRTTVPTQFFINPMQASSREGQPSTKIVTGYVVEHSNALTVIPNTQATSHDSKSARPIPTIGIASTSSTACFLCIATEIRCMIYSYFWTKNVDFCMMHKDIQARSPIHPILQTNRQVRLEAADSLNKDPSVTLHLYAVVEDFDFRKLMRLLKKLDTKYFGPCGRKQLHARLKMCEDILALHIEPGTLGKMFAFMKNNGIAWRYRFEEDESDDGPDVWLPVVAWLDHLAWATEEGDWRRELRSLYDKAQGARKRKMMIARAAWEAGEKLKDGGLGKSEYQAASQTGHLSGR